MTVSKRLVTATLLVYSTIASASAADLKGYGQTPALPENDWQGFYAGVTLGSASAGFVAEETGKRDADFSDTSFQVGALAGYNFTNGPFVWGLETDLQAISFDDKKHAVRGLGTLEPDGNLVGSVRLRAGYAFDTLLVYGTAGVAFSNLELTSSKGGTTEFSTGVALGLGAEWAFDPGWTARAEAMVYAFGEEDAKIGGQDRDLGAAVSSLRLGIARRF